METNWLELAKQILAPVKCRWCNCIINIGERSYPTGGQFVDGEIVEQETMCWHCAQQDAN